eukprot:scaffold1863_cov381-Prasinococcus_capsulatus_cf.AAC.6
MAGRGAPHLTQPNPSAPPPPGRAARAGRPSSSCPPFPAPAPRCQPSPAEGRGGEGRSRRGELSPAQQSLGRGVTTREGRPAQRPPTGQPPPARPSPARGSGRASTTCQAVLCRGGACCCGGMGLLVRGRLHLAVAIKRGAQPPTVPRYNARPRSSPVPRECATRRATVSKASSRAADEAWFAASVRATCAHMSRSAQGVCGRRKERGLGGGADA